jgi:hypothetical protein
MMDLGEELQLPDAGGTCDGHLGIGVHREGDHAVHVTRCETGIVERVQDGLGRESKLAAAGVLGEVRRTDADDRRLAGQFSGHQRPPMVNVAFAIT